MNMPATLSYQQALMPIDPGAIAAAEAVKARIQSAYVMAMQRPRDEDTARAKILNACKRPEFAERVEFRKKQGRKQDDSGRWVDNFITGPSIRFAELAVREWGNIMSDIQVVFEDSTVRRVKVTLLDLQTNASFSKEIQIKKTVERKEKKDREVVGERQNSEGKTVYIVLATDDELHNKESALISKVIRNEGLRLIPSDIVDEAISAARKTKADRYAEDPQAAKKRVLDAFATLGILPRELEKYLGHKLDVVTPTELEELRCIWTSISSGEDTWASYVAEKGNQAQDLAAKVKDAAKPKSTEARVAAAEASVNGSGQGEPAASPPAPSGPAPNILCPKETAAEGSPVYVYETACETCATRGQCASWEE